MAPAAGGADAGRLMLTRHPLALRTIVRGAVAAVVLTLVLGALGALGLTDGPVVGEGSLAQRLAADDGWRPLVVGSSALAHAVTGTVVTVLIAVAGWWRWRTAAAAWLSLAVFGGASVVTAGGKALTMRARPGQQEAVEALGSALPSGHATRAAAVYGLAAALVSLAARRRAVAVGAWALAAGVTLAASAARVALLDHWPTDVASGAAVGVAWLAVCWRLLGPRLGGDAASAPDASG